MQVRVACGQSSVKYEVRPSVHSPSLPSRKWSWQPYPLQGSKRSCQPRGCPAGKLSHAGTDVISSSGPIRSLTPRSLEILIDLRMRSRLPGGDGTGQRSERGPMTRRSEENGPSKSSACWFRVQVATVMKPPEGCTDAAAPRMRAHASCGQCQPDPRLGQGEGCGGGATGPRPRPRGGTDPYLLDARKSRFPMHTVGAVQARGREASRVEKCVRRVDHFAVQDFHLGLEKPRKSCRQTAAGSTRYPGTQATAPPGGLLSQ